MDRNINTKHLNNCNMKQKINNKFKLIMLSLILIFSMFSVSAIKFDGTQNNNYVEYFSKDSGNHIFYNIVGSVNNEIIFNSTTYYYDLRFELSLINEDFFILIENYYPNTTLEVMYQGDLTREPYFYHHPFVMNQKGTYFLKFSPSFNDDKGFVYLNVPETFVGNVRYIEHKPEGLSDTLDNFVGAFVTIIQINVNLWKILFYGLIMLIIIGFIAGLFGASFWLYKKSVEMRESKGFLHIRNNRDKED